MKFIRIDLDIADRRDLTPLDKLVYGVVATYDMKHGCTLGNNQIAEMVNMTPGSVANTVSKLKKKGMITIEIKKTNRGTSRKICVVSASLENDDASLHNDEKPLKQDNPTMKGVNSTMMAIHSTMMEKGSAYKDTHAERFKRDLTNSNSSQERVREETAKPEDEGSEKNTSKDFLSDFNSELQKLLDSGTQVSDMLTTAQIHLVLGAYYLLTPQTHRPTKIFILNRGKEVFQKFAEGYDAEDFIRGMWQLRHCSRANGREGWKWSLQFLIYGSKAKPDVLDAMQGGGYMQPDCKVKSEDIDKIAPYEKLLSSPLPRYGRENQPIGTDDDTPVEIK